MGIELRRGEGLRRNLQHLGVVAVRHVVQVFDQEPEPCHPGLLVAVAIGDFGWADAEAHGRQGVVEPVGQVLEDDALFVLRLVLAVGDQLELVLALEQRVVDLGLVAEVQLDRREVAVAAGPPGHAARAQLDRDALWLRHAVGHRQGRRVGICAALGGLDQVPERRGDDDGQGRFARE